MSLHLIELPIALRALHLWAGHRGIGASDEGLALHHLLGEIFGPAALQPFRLLVAPRARSGTVYAYARADAGALRATAVQVLCPSEANVIRLEAMRSLPRPVETWATGQRLGFDVRLRPVVRLASARQGATETGAQVALAKGAEVDAFLAAALRGHPAAREKIYVDWLAERLAPAAELELETTRLASFQRSRIIRGGKRLEGPDVVIHGTLRITDPIAFADCLDRGIGRHRSYGFGMLLLRPPQRPC